MDRRTFTAAAMLVAALPVSAAAQGADPRTLRVALLPDENASTIIQNAQPLKVHLEKAVGKPVDLVVTTDYSSMIEAMRFGRIDVAYFGPLSYVLARSKAEIEAFAVGVSRGSPTYTSVVVVPADSTIRALADLRGRTVAYGDTASTSSHLVPRAMIQDAGLVAQNDYKTVYLGAHDAVARAVETGKVDAAIEPSMYRFTCGSPIYIDANRVGEMDQIKCHIKEYQENNNYYYPLNKVQFNVYM